MFAKGQAKWPVHLPTPKGVQHHLLRFQGHARFGQAFDDYVVATGQGSRAGFPLLGKESDQALPILDG